MQEIRFHGRGGQGTVVAAILLAKAFFRAGYYVQTFPVFGVERRGAPVEAYLRLDREKILLRCNVYTPDHAVVQDVKLIGSVDVTAGLKPGGWILINAPQPPVNLGPFSGFNLACVDATGIAIQNELGTRTHPIINTAMIGAFARIIEMPPFNMVSEAIKEDISIKPGQNIRASKQAYENVRIIGMIEK
ncbi:MAG: 2-oxoacid:acceptor oxidoreductase family protein [Desulfobacteraceae bacterium]|jgi:pyruvate ferredoxin oxidoreductase gamma subunit/2-oxoisovalerate ferredoxin oxidoreductase gamma subunit|nr:2-oxoacid:acceptor oxidoreductase family protein [Desulfobacteraceae bacterium]